MNNTQSIGEVFRVGAIDRKVLAKGSPKVIGNPFGFGYRNCARWLAKLLDSVSGR